MSQYGTAGTLLPMAPVGKRWAACACSRCRGYNLERRWCEACGGSGIEYRLEDAMRTPLGARLYEIRARITDRRPAAQLIEEMRSRR